MKLLIIGILLLIIVGLGCVKNAEASLPKTGYQGMLTTQVDQNDPYWVDIEIHKMPNGDTCYITTRDYDISCTWHGDVNA